MYKIIDINDIKSEEDDYYFSLMSKDQKERVNGFRFEKDRLRSVGAELLARKMICEASGIPENEIIIKTDSYQDTKGRVELRLEVSDRVEMTFTDEGEQYDPTKKILELSEYDYEHTVGGLGKYITFETADEYSYNYENNMNILRLIKNIR